MRRSAGVLALLALGCVTPTRSTLDAPALRERLASLEAGGAAEQCAERRDADHAPPHPFTSDGCSAWPDSSWARCCLDHDVDYWCGGSADARSAADRRLRACVAEQTGSIGALMWLGVRAGGTPWVPAPWRWGYGWDHPAGYTEP